MKTLTLITSALAFVVLGCSNPYERDNPIDPYVAGIKAVQYEGQTYKTLVIGTKALGIKTWFAENLNYNATGSKCYENLESNCDKYGRLYDWETAKTVCPAGWHLPSDAEWTALVNSTPGKKLKAMTGWNSSSNGDSGNGTDDYGFSALPGGRGYSDGRFSDVGDYGYWWSAYEDNSYRAYSRYIGYHYDYARQGSYDKSYLFSVRCVQD